MKSITGSGIPTGIIVTAMTIVMDSADHALFLALTVLLQPAAALSMPSDSDDSNNRISFDPNEDTSTPSVKVSKRVCSR